MVDAVAATAAAAAIVAVDVAADDVVVVVVVVVAAVAVVVVVASSTCWGGSGHSPAGTSFPRPFEIQIKQGCKLSPTLFSFLRGRRLFAALETTFGADQVVKFLTGYADDLTLHRTIRLVKDLQENSQARRRDA